MEDFDELPINDGRVIDRVRQSSLYSSYEPYQVLCRLLERYCMRVVIFLVAYYVYLLVSRATFYQYDIICCTLTCLGFSETN